MRRRLHNLAAFTLIELLVIIVILGILMAVAVPTFLRQQSKAQDSRTQQYLTTAYKAIRAGTPDNANVYPSSTSMVSWITQSEPELASQNGSCLTAVQNAPQDAILVDPSSSSNSLQLCARSASGNIWKLTATATSGPTLLSGTLVPLTLSGNEITDATRAAGVQGDGLSNDSSTGVWEATTNLLANGGMESNTNNWTYTGLNVTPVTRDTSTARFGAASLKLGPTPNLAVGEGTTTNVAGSPAASNGQTWTASAWVRGASGGETIMPILQAIDGSGTQTEATNGSALTLTTQWQRVTVTRTLSSASTTNIRLRLTTTTQQQATFYVDGVQMEQRSTATPYVDTNGTTATRGAAQIQGPANLLNLNQGWVVFRLKAEVSQPTFELFDWLNDTNNWIEVYSQGAAGLRMRTLVSGSQTGFVSPGVAIAAGTSYTIIATWSTSQIGVSINGANFQTSPATLPALTTSTFGISSRQGSSSPCDCELYWFAAGTGTLSNADAATINGWGNADPAVATFPTAAKATLVWNGSGANASLK